jgi:mono/diheme cytochrome c family protein
MERYDMKRRYILRTVSCVYLFASLWLFQSDVAFGQFTQNKKNTIKIDPSGLPADVQKGYRVLQGKCNECHGLEIILKPSMSPAQWNSEIKRMQAMASSQFDDGQAAAILKFITYDEEHRKSKGKAAVSTTPSDTVAAGRQFYMAQGCDTCHSIAGKGGTMASLDGVGSKLSREELIDRVKAPKAGSAMPPLPSDTTDAEVSHLVDFLLTLKGSPD